MTSIQLFHHSHRVFPKYLKILFVSKLLRAVGVQFADFFRPLFLYQIGVSLALLPLSSFQNGMIFLGGYFLIERLGILFFAFPVARLIQKLGIRNSMILGQLMYLVTLGLYIVGEKNPLLLFAVLGIEVIKLPLFWASYYTLFSTNALYKKMGESVGTLEFFTRLLQAAVPALSGLMIVAFGFPAVFLCAILFQLISTILLLYISEFPTKAEPSVKELKNWFKESEFRLLTLSLGGQYIADMMHFLWPFFVILLVGSADRVGFLYFVVFFVSLLLVYFTGWYIDHSKSRKPFSISGSILGGLWIFRFMATNVWTVMVVDIFDRLADSIYSPFYFSVMLRRGKGDSSLNYFIYREIIISIFGIIFWGFLVLYFFFLDSWRSFILLGFVGMLASMQLRDRKKLVEKK